MKTIFYTLIGSMLIVGCAKETIPDQKPVEKLAIVTQYADMGFAMYSDAVAKARDLKTSVDEFVASPSQAKLDACKIAWKNARVPYAHTEAFRFYGGPIDAAETGREAFINAWPLDESYMDYTATNSTTGIINMVSEYPTINTTLLSSLNQLANEQSLCTGYHAIEFILWGQDLSLTGPGNRPYTDFVDGGTAQNQNRRRDFLVATAQLLVEDLQLVANEWDKNIAENYRAIFVRKSETNHSLAKILKGLGIYTKGEMSGQRISIAYINSDQEDEHDCFSDYTMTDIRNWQSGLKGIYYGNYTKSDGTTIKGASLAEFLKKHFADVHTNITSKFTATDATLASINTTFDQAIISSNADYPKINSLITQLRNQADANADIVIKLEISNEYNGIEE